jgi:predicted secreted protein
MAGISSQALTLTWATVSVTGLGTVTINTNQSMIDTTDVVTGASTFITGNRNTTATIDMFYDQGVAAMATIETASNSGAASATALITLASGMSYSGSAFVTSFSVTGSTNETLRASITLQFTGAVTIT